MEQIVFEVVKSLLSVGGGALAGRLQSRKLSKEMNLLKEENSQQQLNVDSMQSTLIAQQSQLIRYQDELLKTKEEVEKLKSQVRMFEMKSNEDEITKQSLRGRIAELEEICERQEAEIQNLRAQINKVTNAVKRGGTDELKPL